MKITGTKIITLSEDEKDILIKAGRLLSDFADQIDSIGCDDALVMDLNHGYEICLDVARHGKFEYIIDDGEE